MYEVNAGNVIEEYGCLLDFYVNGEKAKVVSFYPVSGEVEVLVELGGKGVIDAHNNIVTARFTPLHLKAVSMDSGATVYERNLSYRPITA